MKTNTSNHTISWEDKRHAIAGGGRSSLSRLGRVNFLYMRKIKFGIEIIVFFTPKCEICMSKWI